MRWLVLLLLVAGCTSAERHLIKARKHIRKAEDLGATWQHDTIYKTVEVIVPETRVDTVFKHRIFTDTLVITKDRVRVKIKIDSIRRDVYTDVYVKPDTVIKEVPVAITNTIKAKAGIPWWVIPALSLCAIFGFGLRGIFK